MKFFIDKHKTIYTHKEQHIVTL